MPSLTIADSTTSEPTLSVTQLYAERGSPKYEKAAMRWLERYQGGELTAAAARRAEIAKSLAAREPDAGGPSS